MDVNEEGDVEMDIDDAGPSDKQIDSHSDEEDEANDDEDDVAPLTTPPPRANNAEEAQAYRRMMQDMNPQEKKVWGEKLKSLALKSALSLQQKVAKQSQCVKEAAAAQKELESYVSPAIPFTIAKYGS